MRVISYNSRILNTQQQKFSTLDREILAIVYALQIYKFLIIGSPHPIYIFTDHQPLLHCFAKKGHLSPKFYRAQMQLTKFSKLKIIHTPGKNLTVADMLSRTFTKEQLQIHQLRHKQLTPQIDFSIMKDNQLKPVNYLVKHKEIKYNKKNDCHLILAEYGDDQFSIRIKNKGEDINIKPLDSFFFQSIVQFESKYKRPTKNQAKSLLQQSTILNDSDNLSDEDELTQSQNTKNQNTNILKEQTLAIQYPTKSDYCNQQVPFFDPSFFKYKRYFHCFFLPEDTQLTIDIIKSQQKQDPVLQKVYHLLKINERPLQIDPTKASNSFLSVYYKLFNQLYINHDTKIILIDYPSVHDSNPNQKEKRCLPFELFHAAFNKLHAHRHSGIKISIKAFNQFCFLPCLNKWMSIFIHDCIECQQNKHINRKIQTATIQTFSENASYFNYRISMDTKGPVSPPSKQNSYFHVIVDDCSHFVVTVPVKQNNAQNAVSSLLHHWITKFGPSIYLVTDRGSEYINSEFANLCTTMGITHSPRTPYAPWTNPLVENQNKTLEPISDFFSITHQKIGLPKSICTLMHIIHNHFLN